MTQQILKQIWNERSRNGWIFAELLIVFCLTWYLVDYAFVMLHNRMIPSGFDVTDTYNIKYIDPLNGENAEDFDRFYRRVKSFPGVKAAYATTKLATDMYSSAYNGTLIMYPDSAGERVSTQIKSVGEDDYFRIFSIHSALTGQPINMDYTDGRQIVLTANLATHFFGDTNPVGQVVWIGDTWYRVIDVAQNQKRYEYYQPGYVTFTTTRKPLDNGNVTIAIRVGDNFDLAKFQDEVTEDIQSYEAVGKVAESLDGVTQERKIRNAVMLFFFLNIALGIIGTFWFRNQSRRSEIGIRMAIGAGKKGIMRYYIGEAVCLLSIATLPALGINLLLLDADILSHPGIQEIESNYITSHKWLRFFIANSLTYLILFFLVAVSAWVPAHQAAHIHPVEALKDE